MKLEEDAVETGLRDSIETEGGLHQPLPPVYDCWERSGVGMIFPHAARFGGYPKYNFIGGHNDPTLIPIDGLIEATTAALRKEGSKLAMYTAAQGNQGHLGMPSGISGPWRSAL